MLCIALDDRRPETSAHQMITSTAKAQDLAPGRGRAFASALTSIHLVTPDATTMMCSMNPSTGSHDIWAHDATTAAPSEASYGASLALISVSQRLTFPDPPHFHPPPFPSPPWGESVVYRGSSHLSPVHGWHFGLEIRS